MRKVIILVIIFTPLIFCCNNKIKDEEKEDINDSKKKTMHETNAICPVLLYELEELISTRDNDDNIASKDIYVVHFEDTEEGCFVLIGASMYYRSYAIKGYLIYNKKLIVFYNPESECNIGLVDIAKLQTGKPDGYLDEYSEKAIHTTYDPRGKRYKIHSKDSLELVFSGYL